MELIEGLVREGIRTYYDVMAPVFRPSRAKKLAALIDDGLPDVMVPMLQFLVSGQADAESIAAADKLEAVRARLAAGGFKTVKALKKRRTLLRIARTGKNRRWGTALHVLAKSARSETILELGTCAGMSGGYLASSPFCKRFISIEGSQDLSRIARETLAEMSPDAEVVNALFDDALDVLLPKLERIDFLFNDGHHEKAAVFHYHDRLVPKLSDDAVLVLDDIRLSADMQDMWTTLIRRPEFSHTFDFGDVGICLRSPGTRPRNWDMQPLTGRMIVV